MWYAYRHHPRSYPAGPLEPLSNDTAGDAYYDPSLVSEVTSCLYNTITYSLVSACGICQGQSSKYYTHQYDLICNVMRQLAYLGRCLWQCHCWCLALPVRFSGSFSICLYSPATRYPLPLPPGLDVPSWAYMNVTVRHLYEGINFLWQTSLARVNIDNRLFLNPWCFSKRK